MDGSFEFSMPSSFLKPRYSSRSPPYEVPYHIIAKRVHSTTGFVRNPECLTRNTTREDIAHACTLEVGPEHVGPASVILDFDVAVAGIPVIQVSSVKTSSAPVFINVTYSEGYPGILREDGDGPFPFSAGADTQRRSRFKITCAGFYESNYVQGSQRWMKIALVEGAPCSVSLNLAGFRPTTSNTPLDQLPGFFECSDPMLNDLWKYGARTLQLNCIPARTVPPPWQVSEDMGILVDSQRCNTYGWGSDWTDYKVEVEGMVVRGGLSWNVRAKGGRPGLLYNLKFSNTGGPPILESWHGYYDKPQKTLVPVLLSRTELPDLTLAQNQWYKIKTICTGLSNILVYLDDVLIHDLEQASTSVGLRNSVPAIPQGSIGFGAGQDQVCRFRNVVVTSVPSGTTLYSSGLNTNAVLADFGVGWNQFPYIFDGAKRDRYAWTADIIIGGQSLYYSTAGSEFIKGNIEASMLRSLARCNEPGLLPGGTPPGRAFERALNDTMFNVLNINYSLYLIMVLYDYWLFTGEADLIVSYWGRIVGCLAHIEALVNDENLLYVTGLEAGDYDYYNGTRDEIYTKRNALYVAALECCAIIARSTIINDIALAKRYESQRVQTVAAINKHMYNSESEMYNISSTRKVGFQQEMHAWLLFKNIAPTNIRQPLMRKFKSLYETTHNQSPLSFSIDTPNVPPVISPIMSAFHVLAAISTGNFSDAEHVLRSVWQPMCDPSSPHFTGTTWEFMLPDGTPFEDQFCSYAQLFSVGPTFILSKFVLGVEPTSPGYKTFSIHPRFPINGVTWAQGRVPTPHGQPIIVRWQKFDNAWRLSCSAPPGLKGVITVPSSLGLRPEGITLNGLVLDPETREVEIGSSHGSEIDILVCL
ncbi:Six-hairpin glycosidase-like protein [Bisporella sp. PMI_857]|nr:Six-hairpin glycosidase-like protein [Bisporella sp. PMI_857]